MHCRISREKSMTYRPGDKNLFPLSKGIVSRTIRIEDEICDFTSNPVVCWFSSENEKAYHDYTDIADFLSACRKIADLFSWEVGIANDDIAEFLKSHPEWQASEDLQKQCHEVMLSFYPKDDYNTIFFSEIANAIPNLSSVLEENPHDYDWVTEIY